MMDLATTSERAVAWHWARAEMSSPRFGHHYQPHLTPSIVTALGSGDAAALSDAEWAHLQHVVFGVRSPLLSGLTRLGTTWYEGKMAPTELPDLRLMNLPQFRDVSPSLRLVELVQALDRGDDVPRDPAFAPNYRSFRATVDATRLTAAPILVATNVGGPYGILEGYSRFAVLLSRQMQGDAPSDIPVVVGVCARIREWRLNDQPWHAMLYWD